MNSVDIYQLVLVLIGAIIAFIILTSVIDMIDEKFFKNEKLNTEKESEKCSENNDATYILSEKEE